MAARLALIASVLVCLGACSRTLAPSEIASLSDAAPGVLQAASLSSDVPASQWPPAVSRLKPERVYVTPDGLYVVTSSFFVEERGFFVPRTAGFSGQSGTDPSYTLIGQGVYSYHIKG